MSHDPSVRALQLQMDRKTEPLLDPVRPNSAQVGARRCHTCSGDFSALLCCGFCPQNVQRARRPSFPPRPLRSDHKARDVTRSPDIKGRAAPGKADCAALGRPGPPRVSVRPPRPPPSPPRLDDTPTMERLLKKCRIENRLLRECLAEFLGVYVLIVSIGDVGGLVKAAVSMLKKRPAGE